VSVWDWNAVAQHELIGTTVIDLEDRLFRCVGHRWSGTGV
jgi:hypothetical protein